jgi:hypothetical protein
VLSTTAGRMEPDKKEAAQLSWSLDCLLVVLIESKSRQPDIA